MKRLWPVCIGVIGFLLAATITVYPLVSNHYAEQNKSLVLTEYAQAVQTLEEDNLTELLTAAREYNASLAPGTISMEGAFMQEALIAASEDYYELLSVNVDGIMGYVEIPKIAVYLPIYHGTDSDALDHGAGHLLGSSLPVGGDGTHTVITGHSGMARQKMFSDLDQVKVGDVFYLHVLNETLAYEVDQIKIVLPNNTSYLGIERGQDYCTLVTCTPYAVNTHRLLVRGHRVPYAEEVAEMEEQPEAEPVKSTWTAEYIKGIALGLVAVILILIVIGVLTNFGRRGKHERR